MNLFLEEVGEQEEGGESFMEMSFTQEMEEGMTTTSTPTIQSITNPHLRQVVETNRLLQTTLTPPEVHLGSQMTGTKSLSVVYPFKSQNYPS